MNTGEKKEKKEKNDDSDEDIVIRVQRGDDSAFQILVERYSDKLTRYVQRFVRQSDEAHDIVQDAFIKAHTHIDRFEAHRRFSPWIYRITRNTALTHANRPHVRDTVTLETSAHSESLIDDEKSALEQWLQKELHAHVHEAIRSLPDEYAEAIYLRYIDELSYQEISDIIGKPVNTVGTLIRRAKKRMLTILVEEGAEQKE